MRGAAGRIGFLFPGDGLNDDEFWSWLPDGVAWLTARYPGTLPDQPLNHATFKASADLGPMVAAAKVLAEAHPDVIVTGDHAGSFILGQGHDVTQAKAIAQASGARAGSTPSTAIIAALQSLGIARVAITSPYDADVTAAGRFWKVTGSRFWPKPAAALLMNPAFPGKRPISGPRQPGPPITRKQGPLC